MKLRVLGLLLCGMASATALAQDPAPTVPADKAPAAKAPPATVPADPAAKKDDTAAKKDANTPAAASAAGKPAKDSAGTPQRFVPTEQVRSDFDVSFPVDI